MEEAGIQLAASQAAAAQLQSRLNSAEAENCDFREEIAKIAACHQRELRSRDETASQLRNSLKTAEAAADSAAEEARAAGCRAAASEVGNICRLCNIMLHLLEIQEGSNRKM